MIPITLNVVLAFGHFIVITTTEFTVGVKLCEVKQSKMMIKLKDRCEKDLSDVWLLGIHEQLNFLGNGYRYGWDTHN